MSIEMQDNDSPPIYEAPSGEELTVPNFDDAIDGEARDAEQPEEQPGELPAGETATSWDKAWIDAYLENNIAQHPKQAVNILNKLQPANKTEALRLGKVYRGFRDKYEKMSSDEAAAKTLKGEKP